MQKFFIADRDLNLIALYSYRLESVLVLHKAHLYLARAYRDFDKDLVLEYFYESLLCLINEPILDNLERVR